MIKLSLEEPQDVAAEGFNGKPLYMHLLEAEHNMPHLFKSITIFQVILFHYFNSISIIQQKKFTSA